MANINVGAEVAEIHPESLGLKALGAGGLQGAKSLKLLPTPWPADGLPPSSATLLSVSSSRRLLAAAGPDTLFIASTPAVRSAFGKAGGEDDIITDFTPDFTLSVPQLRHVAFSAAGDFLVISSEHSGGLAVYEVDNLLQQRHEPTVQISTDQIPLRALLPNPNAEFNGHIAAVLDTGKLVVVDIVAGKTVVVREERVTCAAWSVKGKAIIAGLDDGTAVQYKLGGGPLGTIPRPPNVDESYIVSAVFWLNNEEFFLVHSPITGNDHPMEPAQDSAYHIVKSDKGRTTYYFHQTECELCWANMGPVRQPPLRFSVKRLRAWEPSLTDLLILASSNCSDVVILTKSSEKIAPDQEESGGYAVTKPLDNRLATLPPMVFGGDGDSVLIGEALDLSAEEKVVRPVPTLEEINKSPFPLPAYFALNHEGILSAWWIVWDRSMSGEKMHPYPGLVSPSDGAIASHSATTPSVVPASTTTSGSFRHESLNVSGPTTTRASSTFGQQTPVPATPLAPKLSTSGPAQPAFGTTSNVGAFGKTGFGTAGPMGNRASPWSSSAQSTPQNTFGNTASAPSGFAKFGGGNTSTTPFSSFNSINGGPSASPFSSVGQSNPGFGGSTNAGGFKGLADKPSSFGSTLTIGSAEGSTLPSWANTPAQMSSGFGQNASATTSFASNKESDVSDTDDAHNRTRDEATPTPQAPPPGQKPLDLAANGFTLGSTFKGDGTAKDDLPKPVVSSGNSLFGGDFATTLDTPSSKPPATPIRQEETASRLRDVSTTPASPPKPQHTLSSRAAQTKGTKAPPEEQSPVAEDAPLPPDPDTWKPTQSTEDELPPLAGSPGIKVEAPDLSVPTSPSDEGEGEGEDDGEEDFSVEEVDRDEDNSSPADVARGHQPPKPTFILQDSVNRFPNLPAPTPPVGKSATYSPAERSISPIRQPIFGESNGAGSLFARSSNPAPTGYPRPHIALAPSSRRARENLRSPSPVRAVSAAPAFRSQRERVDGADSTSSTSIIPQSHPLTAEPQVSDLIDDEDARIRKLLASEIEANPILDDFIARKEYDGTSQTKTGHAAQIEIVYRDINNMVDTLGLNWRSLKAFILYNEQSQRFGEHTRAELEDIEGQGEEGSWLNKWSLCETDDLKRLEDELEHELDEGRVRDVLEKLSQLARLMNDKGKLMTKLNDIRRQLINRKDPEKVEAHRKASLPKELADQQKALRTDFAKLLTLLGKAEEAAILLRSRLASQDAENGKTGAVPTVDQVKKTIMKMISLAEKKNSEVVLLESQLRKMGLGEDSRPTSSSPRNLGTPTRRSRAFRGESPFATPPTNRSKMTLSELHRRALTPEVETTPSNGYGLYYTPEGTPSQGNELVRLGDVVNDNLSSLRETAKRRRKIASGLKSALLERDGVKVTTVG